MNKVFVGSNDNIAHSAKKMWLGVDGIAVPISAGGSGEAHGATIIVTAEDFVGMPIYLKLDNVVKQMKTCGASGEVVFSDIQEDGEYTIEGIINEVSVTTNVVITTDDIVHKTTSTAVIYASVELTVNIIGANEDNITIVGRNGQMTETCVFNSKTTSKTITLSAPIGAELTFTSTISKYVAKLVPTVGVSNYTVRMMPDNCLYWYGNKVVGIASTEGGDMGTYAEEKNNLRINSYYSNSTGISNGSFSYNINKAKAYKIYIRGKYYNSANPYVFITDYRDYAGTTNRLALNNSLDVTYDIPAARKADTVKFAHDRVDYSTVYDYTRQDIYGIWLVEQ